MYLCYIDESGTSALPGNTSHFILAGIAIPIWKWKQCDKEISAIKIKYDIEFEEIHTAWLLRPYIEQQNIPNFDSMSYQQRRLEVDKQRKMEIFRLQKANKSAQLKQTKKNYKCTSAYIHLSMAERKSLIEELLKMVSNWRFARLFAECIDKVHFNPTLAGKSVDEQSFEQIISRFETFLSIKSKTADTADKNYFGILIHDNNETVARKHTNLMKNFHRQGTLWTKINHIIETPLFVDSDLTSLVQIADLCSYTIRRYFENNEAASFNKILPRADRKNNKIVGIRHFSSSNCKCLVCNPSP